MYIIKINQNIYQVPYYMKNFSLLKILKFHNIYLSYQCQEGYCGTCIVKLICGKIKYFKKNILAVKKKGYIFPCCCIINSNIKIII